MTLYDVAIIGAGYTGLVYALELYKCGYKNILVLDENNTFGGVWSNTTQYVDQCLECPLWSYIYIIVTQYPLECAPLVSKYHEHLQKPASAKIVYEFLKVLYSKLPKEIFEYTTKILSIKPFENHVVICSSKKNI